MPLYAYYMPVFLMLSFILVHGIFFEATSHENGILKPQRAATSLVPPTQRSHQWEHVICVYGKHWQKTMERSTRFDEFWWEKSLDFYWAIFKSPVQSLPEGMSMEGFCSHLSLPEVDSLQNLLKSNRHDTCPSFPYPYHPCVMRINRDIYLQWMLVPI